MHRKCKNMAFPTENKKGFTNISSSSEFQTRYSLFCPGLSLQTVVVAYQPVFPSLWTCLVIGTSKKRSSTRLYETITTYLKLILRNFCVHTNNHPYLERCKQLWNSPLRGSDPKHRSKPNWSGAEEGDFQEQMVVVLVLLMFCPTKWKFENVKNALQWSRLKVFGITAAV